MKLSEFYKNLYEVAAPVTHICVDWEKTIKGMVELPPLGVVDEKSFCANCMIDKNFYTAAAPAATPYCECCLAPSKPKVVDPKPKDGLTPAFLETIKKGYSQFGCGFLESNKTKHETKLGELKGKGGNPKWVKMLMDKITYIDKIIKKDCTKETQTKPKPTTLPQVSVKPTEVPTETPTETPQKIEKTFEQPKIIPEPVYNQEDEIVNIDSVQTNELVSDLEIELEREIVNQLPEVQKRLEEFNIDAEKMSYVIPLTTESKNFMMELEMNGVKLPYLMLYYENLETLNNAVQGNTYVEFNKLQPLKNRVNYKDFWEWTKSLWEGNNEWIKTKVRGTIPEFDKSTILP